MIKALLIIISFVIIIIAIKSIINEKNKYKFDEILNYKLEEERFAETIDSGIDILNEYIEDLSKKGEKGSRAKLIDNLKNKGINFSEQMIRSRLNELEKLGYIEKKKGRWGTTITASGITQIKGFKD